MKTGDAFGVQILKKYIHGTLITMVHLYEIETKSLTLDISTPLKKSFNM